MQAMTAKEQQDCRSDGVVSRKFDIKWICN